MMIDKGGTAFPQHSSHGMTLRDYFAAHAPRAPEWWLNAGPFDPHVDLSLDDCARHIADWAYTYADAMLATRKT